MLKYIRKNSNKQFMKLEIIFFNSLISNPLNIISKKTIDIKLFQIELFQPITKCKILKINPKVKLYRKYYVPLSSGQDTRLKPRRLSSGSGFQLANFHVCKIRGASASGSPVIVKKIHYGSVRPLVDGGHGLPWLQALSN